MASLKEIKGRIASVDGTLKITSAMKMVASAKLHRSQMAAERLARYETLLSQLTEALDDPEVAFDNPWSEEHAENCRVAIIAIASDSSLCGAFNHNAIKRLWREVERLREIGFNEITCYPIGEKMVQAVIKSGLAYDLSFRHLADNGEFGESARLADELMRLYESKKIDCVRIVYNHFFSMGHQEAIVAEWLPMEFTPIEEGPRRWEHPDYLLEPDAESLRRQMIPYTLRIQLHKLLLNSAVAEHAARMIAMQTATDNATDLLQALRLSYNKRRQQAITEELADITQASAAD